MVDRFSVVSRFIKSPENNTKQMQSVNKNLLINYISKLQITKNDKLDEILTEVRECKDKLAVQENVLTKIIDENKILRKRVKKLNKRLADVENDINQTQKYIRRNNI